MASTLFATLNTIVCCNCGVVFGLEAEYERRRRNDGALFTCPNGHQQHFTGLTEADRLRAQLERERKAAKETREYLEQRVRAEQSAARGAAISAGHAKGKLRRLHERVAAGVCPDCHRTFKQLAAHMKSKHAHKHGTDNG